MDKGLQIEYLESELEDFKFKLEDLIEWCESSFKYLEESPSAHKPKMGGNLPSFLDAFKMAVKSKREFLEEHKNNC